MMEKNYLNMAREVAKFEAEGNNTVSAEKQTDGPYGGMGYNEKEVSG